MAQASSIPTPAGLGALKPLEKPGKIREISLNIGLLVCPRPLP
jgi:hypothetical protein